MTTNLPLINQEDEQYSLSKLNKYYQKGLIPPEKKGYLTQLKNSQGPYMAVESAHAPENSHYLLDAASQIATLGLGFNTGTFFGTGHLMESWLNDRFSDEIQSVRTGLNNFLKRQLGWSELYSTYVNSGAEANEVALGACYKNRRNLSAQKVLAFEGSFHGRMMVSLSATWNADKRVPFEWPGKETIYAPFPSSLEGEIEVALPEYWRKVWDQAARQEFGLPRSWEQNKDQLLEDEIKSLLFVREQLLSGKIFAIIIEPMQCEGGDRYATNRFHTALLLMANSFGVEVVYDEVQTGFHLGRKFFWHKQFKLQDVHGQELKPHYIVCAKKAQIGMVISHQPILEEKYESYQVASMVRGYHHAVALDQAQDRILALEKKSLKYLKKWQQKYPDHLQYARACGLSFAIDLKDSKYVNTFISKRFAYGLLYYPAGSHTLRFRLNTAFLENDLEFLFQQLDQLSQEIFFDKTAPLATYAPKREDQSPWLYEWQELMLQTKLDLAHGEKITSQAVLNKISILMAKHWEGELITINSQNFEQLRGAITEIQRKNYELARQTTIDKFFTAAKHPKGIALGLLKKGVLEGIIFAAPLKCFELEGGVRRDPYFHDEDVLYMLDTTVNETMRGQGLGRFLKYALVTYAMSRGVKRINGRNRDRLASSMMAINLSLGSYELQYTPEDYPDYEEFRDVFYYTTPLLWQEGNLRLGHGIESPLGILDLDKDFVNEQLPLVNNKVCLSNFISERFLTLMDRFAATLPEELRHLYSVSGQSEAIDKIAKSLWYNSDKKSYQMISFKGHEFGRGSFVSRALSGDKHADYFPVTHFEHPNMDNFEIVLEQLENYLQKNKALAIWIEPLLQRTMERVPEVFLMALREMSRRHKVALVYNETAASFYRYDSKHFFASGNGEIMPDAGLCFTGGQSGVVFINRSNFVDKPLMLISTWDGDEFAFANFMHALTQVENSPQTYLEERAQFQSRMEELLSPYQDLEIELENGVGFVRGALPSQLKQYFINDGDRSLICPSWGEIKRFHQKFAQIKQQLQGPWE